MSRAIDNWFDFVENYYRQSSVPLSWMLIGGGEVTSVRMAGTPIGMTTLSKREWNKIATENNAPSRNLPGGVAVDKNGGEE